MTTQLSPVTPQQGHQVPRRDLLPRRWRPVAYAVGALALLSLVRVITGVQDITSGGALGGTINLAMPIALAGLGGLWSERSGVVNIGLEGMMILGTWFGAAFAYYGHSPWLGLLGGLVGGLLGGLIHAVATVTFRVDQIVSGVAITILAGGVAKYLSGIFFANESGGGPTQSPQVPTFPNLNWVAAGNSLGKIEAHHWFFVSDAFGLLRGLLTSLPLLTIIAILLLPASWFVLWRTPFGLRLRACGENPDAADAQGVSVYRTKYTAVMVSGMLAGLAGFFLVNNVGIYREGQTAGRGYIGLAAMIFGNWRPGGLAAGSLLFGYTDALQQRSGATAVHALLLFVAFLLLILAIPAWLAGRRVNAAVLVVLAALVSVWYLLTKTVPAELATYTPQIVTLVVLAVASQRLRPPAADGLPWRRGGG